MEKEERAATGTTEKAEIVKTGTVGIEEEAEKEEIVIKMADTKDPILNKGATAEVASEEMKEALEVEREEETTETGMKVST